MRSLAPWWILFFSFSLEWWCSGQLVHNLLPQGTCCPPAQVSNNSANQVVFCHCWNLNPAPKVSTHFIKYKTTILGAMMILLVCSCWVRILKYLVSVEISKSQETALFLLIVHLLLMFPWLSVARNIIWHTRHGFSIDEARLNHQSGWSPKTVREM